MLNPQQPVSRNLLRSGGNILTHGAQDGDFLYTTAPSFNLGVFWSPSILSKRVRISALPEVGLLYNCPNSYDNTCIPINLPNFGDLVISDDSVFVATTDGIRIFGASGADELDELNRTSFGNDRSLLTVGNGAIFMGSNADGIKVLEIEDGTEPPIGGNNTRIYGDNLASGWQAGTLGSISYNLSNTAPVDEGSRSISASFDGPWSALFLESNPPVDTSTVTGLRFSVYGTQANQTIRIKTMSSIWEQSAGRTITLEPNQWQQITLTKEELGDAIDYRYLLFENPNAESQPIFYLDDITLLGGEGGSTNRPPTLVNPGNQSSTQGELVSLSIQASDPDNDALSYSASNLPDGLSLNTASGQISGATLTPGFTNVSITVSDGQESVTVQFGWTVSEDTPPVGGSALSIYTDAISADWSAGAWGSTTIVRDNPSPVIEGARSLAVTYNEQWATLYFRAEEPLNELNYESLYFQVYPTAANQEVKIQIMDSNLKTSEGFYVIRPQANQWSIVTIPLSVFREIDGIYYITFHNPRTSGQPTFYLDDVKLTRVPGVEDDGVFAAGLDYAEIEYGTNGLPTRFRFDPNSGQVILDPQTLETSRIFLPFTSGR